MDKKDFLKEKYCEINHLKNLLQTYPKEYCETIIKVMNKVFDEISEYLEEQKKEIKKKTYKKSRDNNLTLNQLAKFNGKDGNPSYVAVNGIIYDVSAIPQWSNGNHYGLKAGVDLSNQINGCHPGNLSILDNAEIVGNLITESTRAELPYFKIEEVSKYDGVGENLAYVVVNGIVYDVTGIKAWRNGKHYGLIAGKDLSNYFSECHKEELALLKKLKAVGKIIE